MLLPLLLLAAQDPETAVDAERAFNRAAQTEGQWTAFREFMAEDAIVFTPQPVKAKDALPTKNPPIAVQWWPAESYVSCDGNTAVNTGPWVRPSSVGYFTTVWQRQADGHFKWVMDGGDALVTPHALPETPKVRRGNCSGKARPFIVVRSSRDPQDKVANGESADHSLAWSWIVKPDGSRTFKAWLWVRARYVVVVDDEIAADK